MKLGVVRQNGSTRLAVVHNGNIIDVTEAAGTTDLKSIVAEWETLFPRIAASLEHGTPLTGDIVWQAPLPAPPKFLLLAGNFRAHVIESGFAPAPEENLTPQFFMKPSTAIIGPSEEIPLTDANHALDYEAELAVVIGRRTHRVSHQDAMLAVWGYTVVNDISERKLNDGMIDRKKRSNDDFYDWLVGKWFDGSAPMGPWLVTAGDLPADARVQAWLNGEQVQDAPLSAMIHTIAEAIVYISDVLTLEPGDVISMGTPAGVGLARGRLLRDGDLIECEVSGVGRICNYVRKAL